MIKIQPMEEQNVEDVTEQPPSEPSVKEIQNSIESNIKQIGMNLSADAIRRI